jgi:hypothetical protein
MATVAQITDALKKFLKARGMTYAALGRCLNLSEGSIKRLFSTSSFTLQDIYRAEWPPLAGNPPCTTRQR